MGNSKSYGFTPSPIRARGLAHIQKAMLDAGIPVLQTELNERDAFKAVFVFDVTLDQLDPKDVPNLDKAKLNVMELAEEIVARLMAAGRGLESVGQESDRDTDVESAA